MKKYVYSVKEFSGKNINGTLLAESINEAAEMLRSQKYILLDLTEEKLTVKQYFKQGLSLKTKVKTDNVVTFCKQLSIMIKSGITLKDSIEVISSQMKNKSFKNILYAVSLQLQTGKTLYDSLSIYKNSFPQTLFTLIAVGETSGRLDEALNSAAIYIERDYQAREKLKTAAVYPLILVTVFFITSIIMLTVVLPMFAVLLKNLNVPLPFITRAILFLSEVTKNYGIQILLLIITALIMIKFVWRKWKHQYAIYMAIFKIPLLGQLVIETILLQLCNEIAVMTSSGITIDKIITVVLDNSPNICFERALKDAQADIQKGHSLSFSLAKSKLFPPLFMQMLTAGETSGNLSHMMNDAAGFYQNSVDMLYKRIVAISEPCMIIVISIFIGTFVAAIAVPMLDAASGVSM